jgi:hypothetical protein
MTRTNREMVQIFLPFCAPVPRRVDSALQMGPWCLTIFLLEAGDFSGLLHVFAYALHMRPYSLFFAFTFLTKTSQVLQTLN